MGKNNQEEDKQSTNDDSEKLEKPADQTQKQEGLFSNMKKKFFATNGTKQKNKETEDLNELPGFFSFLKDNWQSKKKTPSVIAAQATENQNSEKQKNGDTPTKPKKENWFGRFNRIYQTYQNVKEQQVGKLQIYESIAMQTSITKEFGLLLAGSTIIATFGLLQGSTAVIIGAMLIAPLMMPILGFSLGTIWGDVDLIKKAVLTLIVGSAFSFLIAFLISALLPGTEFNQEILSRTKPNIFDIVIALASGIVGAYAYVNPNISASVSGVAIAVALLPPLCTIGIALGHMELRAAFGAFLLYTINLVGISLAASFVFWRMKVHPVQTDQKEVKKRAKKNVALSAATLLLIALPLGFFMFQTYQLKKNRTEVLSIMQSYLPGVEILSLDMSKQHYGYYLKSVFIMSQNIDYQKIQDIKVEIANLLQKKVQFHFIPLITHEILPANPQNQIKDDNNSTLTAPQDPTPKTEKKLDKKIKKTKKKE